MKDKLNRFFSVYIFCVEYKMLNSAESRSLLGSLSILCGLNICKKKNNIKMPLLVLVKRKTSVKTI